MFLNKSKFNVLETINCKFSKSRQHDNYLTKLGTFQHSNPSSTRLFTLKKLTSLEEHKIKMLEPRTMYRENENEN